MTGSGTNTYLVGGQKVVIIDPGPADETHQQAIVAALQTLHAEAQAVVVTHSHPDHSESAPALAHRLNIPLFSFSAPLRHNDSLQLTLQPSTYNLQLITFNLQPSTFNLQPSTLTILPTPGHTADHLCLWWAEPRLLFAGDLVAGAGTVLIVPPDGDMAAYLDSLRAMLALSPQVILPGHGPVIEDAPALLQQYLDHRLQREQQVLALLAQGYTTAAAIAAQIYADRPEALAIATLQVEAHLEKLRNKPQAFQIG